MELPAKRPGRLLECHQTVEPKQNNAKNPTVCKRIELFSQPLSLAG